VCSTQDQGSYSCLPGTFCGDIGLYDITPEEDGAFQDPQIQYGFGTFHNLYQSFGIVFQFVSKDNWAIIMFNLMDS